jgi:hypothetical protein
MPLGMSCIITTAGLLRLLSSLRSSRSYTLAFTSSNLCNSAAQQLVFIFCLQSYSPKWCCTAGQALTHVGLHLVKPAAAQQLC